MQNREGGYPNFRWGCPKLIPEQSWILSPHFDKMRDLVTKNELFLYLTQIITKFNVGSDHICGKSSELLHYSHFVLLSKHKSKRVIS